MIAEALELVRDFMGAGGDVLWAICAVTLLMWTMILEREWYFHFRYTKDLEEVMERWGARSERVSWVTIVLDSTVIGSLGHNTSTVCRVMLSSSSPPFGSNSTRG